MRRNLRFLVVCSIGLAVVLAVVRRANAQAGSEAAKPLSLNQTIKGRLQPGQAESFVISLDPGDFAQAVVNQIRGWVDVTVCDPAGQAMKTVSHNPIAAQHGPVEVTEVEDVNIVALRAGHYQLEVRAVGNSGEVQYSIFYSEHATKAKRMQVPAVYRPDRSPRLQALHRELRAGHPEALASFWKEVEEAGSPIIESMPNDPKRRLVTVVYRDTARVYNVGLHWESYAYNEPEQYTFSHEPNTDLWYLTLALPSNARFVYQLSPDDDLVPYNRLNSTDANARERHEAGEMPDPLNPHHWIQQNGDFSLVELPDAPPQPWIIRRPGVPQGQVEKTRFRSELLKNEREVAVYTPPGYSKSHPPYWLMVLFDEEAYLTMIPTPAILDNLIAAKKIPPIVAVLVSPVDRATRRKETLGPLATQYADAMSTELISWIRGNYNVTTDPAHIIAAGSSANGFASVYMAYRHPDVYGNVLCQSGSLYWEPGTRTGSGKMIADNPDWLAQRFAAEPRKSIRFFMEAGVFEDSRGGILDASRHFRDVAIAKGYGIHYQEFVGGHKYINWRGSIADGLIYLTGGGI